MLSCFHGLPNVFIQGAVVCPMLLLLLLLLVTVRCWLCQHISIADCLLLTLMVLGAVVVGDAAVGPVQTTLLPACCSCTSQPGIPTPSLKLSCRHMCRSGTLGPIPVTRLNAMCSRVPNVFFSSPPFGHQARSSSCFVGPCDPFAAWQTSRETCLHCCAAFGILAACRQPPYWGWACCTRAPVTGS
jgi:hypothetical protein